MKWATKSLCTKDDEVRVTRGLGPRRTRSLDVLHHPPSLALPSTHPVACAPGVPATHIVQLHLISVLDSGKSNEVPGESAADDAGECKPDPTALLRTQDLLKQCKEDAAGAGIKNVRQRARQGDLARRARCGRCATRALLAGWHRAVPGVVWAQDPGGGRKDGGRPLCFTGRKYGAHSLRPATCLRVPVSTGVHQPRSAALCPPPSPPHAFRMPLLSCPTLVLALHAWPRLTVRPDAVQCGGCTVMLPALPHPTPPSPMAPAGQADHPGVVRGRLHRHGERRPGCGRARCLRRRACTGWWGPALLAGCPGCRQLSAMHMLAPLAPPWHLGAAPPSLPPPQPPARHQPQQGSALHAASRVPHLPVPPRPPQARHIVDYSDSEGADMLVLGSRGMGGFKRAFYGMVGAAGSQGQGPGRRGMARPTHAPSASR